MSKGQKILTVTLWGVLVLVMLGVIGAGLWPRSQDRDLPILFETPGFQLTNQTGRTVTDHDLHGNVWIVDFIFTSCAGPCPIMSAQMAKLQQRMPQTNIKFVSVTVDPERDTPQVLKDYGQEFGADPARWYFLTGAKQAVWEMVAGMKLPGKPADEQGPILHSEKFLLVDGHGCVRGAYSSRTEQSLDQLVADALMLARQSHEGGRP